MSARIITRVLLPFSPILRRCGKVVKVNKGPECPKDHAALRKNESKGVYILYMSIIYFRQKAEIFQQAETQTQHK